MAPNDAALCSGQKPETMTPRRRILASGALGCGGNTHTRRNQYAYYGGVRRNRDPASAQSPPASSSAGTIPLHPEGIAPTHVAIGECSSTATATTTPAFRRQWLLSPEQRHREPR